MAIPTTKEKYIKRLYGCIVPSVLLHRSLTTLELAQAWFNDNDPELLEEALEKGGFKNIEQFVHQHPDELRMTKSAYVGPSVIVGPRPPEGIESNMRLIRSTQAAKKPNPFNSDKGIMSRNVQARLSRLKMPKESGKMPVRSSESSHPCLPITRTLGFTNSHGAAFRSGSSCPGDNLRDTRYATTSVPTYIKALDTCTSTVSSSHDAPASSTFRTSLYQTRIQSVSESVRVAVRSNGNRKFEPFYPSDASQHSSKSLDGLSIGAFLAASKPEARRAGIENHLATTPMARIKEGFVPPELISEDELDNNFEWKSDDASEIAIPVDKIKSAQQLVNHENFTSPHSVSQGTPPALCVEERVCPPGNGVISRQINEEPGTHSFHDKLYLPPLYMTRCKFYRARQEARRLAEQQP